MHCGSVHTKCSWLRTHRRQPLSCWARWRAPQSRVCAMDSQAGSSGAMCGPVASTLHVPSVDCGAWRPQMQHSARSISDVHLQEHHRRWHTLRPQQTSSGEMGIPMMLKSLCSRAQSMPQTQTQ